MKINNKDLKDLYKAYIMENAPLSRKNCPQTKEIINLFRSKLSEKQKSKTIDHITNCYFCSQEFEFILQTLRQEKKLRDEIRRLLLSKKEAPLNKQGSEKKINDLRKKLIPFFPRLSWKYASLFMGITVIISVLFALIIFYTHEKKDFRGQYLTPIKLIEPVKGKYQKSLLEFRWEEIKGVEYYILELFDETLLPIWKSKKIFNSHIVLPKKTGDSLAENKLYFWMLTAYFPDGRKIESRIENFVLRK